MKRVVASAGIFAVGMAGVRGANVAGLTTQEQSKWWVVSGSLRGFYDDNSLNSPDALAEPSTGFEIHPGVSLNFPMERTLFSVSYDLTLNYYLDRPSSKLDQSHIFDTRLNHRFTERYDVNVENSFVYSDEPAVLAAGGGAVDTVVRRGDASGLRNRALIDFSGRMTPTLGGIVGYKNNFRDYKQTNKDIGTVGSYSALFDSVENLFHVDVQWFKSETTVYFTGYQFGLFNYTSSDPIGVGYDPGLPGSTHPPGTPTMLIYPDSKNNHSHYLYLGTRREFSEKLTGGASVGAQYTDYYNANDSALSPYLDLKVNYIYLPGSSVQAGLSVARVPADVGIGSDGELTLDSLAGTFYGSINHRITSRLNGTLYLSYQRTTYNGGIYDGDSSDYLTIDSRVDFKLRENLFLDLGYVWYLYTSSIPGVDFTRNRVYLGIRATY
jgi:hypothetical protein